MMKASDRKPENTTWKKSNINKGRRMVKEGGS
jgi:hypothetical protein